jgi:hypothetical protein
MLGSIRVLKTAAEGGAGPLREERQVGKNRIPSFLACKSLIFLKTDE